MDTLLVQGDHYLDGRGLPAVLTGDNELVQQALIRLSVPRGSFALDPSLGSELHKLRNAGPRMLDRIALSYAQEALAPIPDISVEDVTVRRQGRDRLQVAVRIRRGGRIFPLETVMF